MGSKLVATFTLRETWVATVNGSRFQYYLILAATFIVGGLVGAAIGKAVFGEGLTADVIANLGVAVGTFALAAITFASVMKTNDVISGEDRRHQQSYAPALEFAYLDSTNDEWTIGIQNKGIGPATNITIRLDGEFTQSDELREKLRGRGTLSKGPVRFRDGHKERKLSYLAARGDEYGGVALGKPPVEHLDRVNITYIEIEYDDMFKNTYRTTYPLGMLNLNDHTWQPPDKLNPPK